MLSLFYQFVSKYIFIVLNNIYTGVICCTGDFKSDQSVPSDGGASYSLSLHFNVSVTNNSQPQTPQKTRPLVTTEDQTEEEDEEIDVLLCSPEKAAHERAALSSIVITVDEEEEEENEIDVTGDEA